MSHNVNWYKKEADYLRMKEFCVDKDSFCPTYKEWCAVVEKKIAEVARQGISLVKKNIEPDAFIAWCSSTSNIPNAKSRGLFAAVSHALEARVAGDDTTHH
jgi:hypothetical protein